MNIENLTTFIEIVNNKSFTRTAKSMQISQPSVSKRVVAMETELSTKLFDRNIGRNLQLTEAGQALVPTAYQISNDWSRIANFIKNLADGGVSGSLCIGTSELTATHWMPDILEIFRKRHPEVTVELMFGNSQETLHALESSTIELALCSPPEEKRPRHGVKLNQSPLWFDNLVFVASYDNPITALDTIGLSDLANYPAILPRGPSHLRSLIDNAFTQNGLIPQVSMEAGDLETIRCMACIDIGWACVPEYLLDDTLVVLDVDEIDLNRVVSLIRLNERTLSNAAQAFQDLLLERYSSALDNHATLEDPIELDPA